MTASDSIDVGEAGGFVWLRINGKGSFLCSPQVKEYVEARLQEGSTRFVIDLTGCNAMDSTFMGTLAGIAIRLGKRTGEKLQVAAASDRNRQSLQDLGLDLLMDIDPENAEWRRELATIEECLEPWGEGTAGAGAAHVLEAHQRLCEANDENAKKFATVLDVLEQEARGE
ncbi:MAG: STAS domain-containing protein [Akkermansiaceae bacterium]|nr:STAS domain-containing protein [Akkermansiaceae bacterium]NNM30561.1 STAS domain-containing protein [Akkermansiaceae bacterium]